MAEPRIKYVLLAESARRSATGDLTLDKLMQGGMVISRPPGPLPANTKPAIPQLTLVAVANGLAGIAKLRFRMRVKHGGEETVHFQPEKFDERKPVDSHTWTHVISPFLIPGAGEYRFEVELDLEDRRTIKFVEVLNVEIAGAGDTRN